MSTKNQAKTRNSRYAKQSALVDEEIIEITEPSNYKSKVYQRRKEPTENISSEATTPNKRKTKKKKIDNDLIEVIDTKDVGKNMKNKRDNSKGVKREAKKGKNKSVDKIRKNNVNNKKEKKIRSINLEESDNEVEEIKLISKATRPSKKSTKKSKTKRMASKTPDKRDKRKNHNIPKKKNPKVKQVNNKNKITQYELSSSEESDVEMTKEKTKSGFFSSRKASQAKDKNEQENTKSKSTIKASKENISFLGKKRKNERNVKSRTPNKINKSQIRVVNKIPIEIKNSPIKMRAGKSSRTPVKNPSKKIKHLFPADSGLNHTINNKNYVSPELAVLNQLIVEFGFEKVLDSLCKAKLNHKNKLDSCVQGLRDSCANEKLPLFLIKMLFSYFDHKEKEKVEEEKPQEKEAETENKKSLSFIKSTSAENTNTNNELNEPSEKPTSKSPIKATNSVTNTKIETSITPVTKEESTPIQITDETPKKIIKSVISEKKKEEKSPVKAKNEEGKKEKKNMSIGSHYHKDEDGLIYKYQVFKLDGQGNAIFKCYDDKCSSEGMYDLDSRKFSVTVKHSLKHNEHDYIIHYDKIEDNVFKEMANLNKNDAQVFKEGNERSVKLY